MNKNINIKNNIFALLLSTLGTAFLIYYIFRASKDVVASDYIRIINYYLDDVKDLHYLFSWEGISRIPITFLFRFINVEFFKYSVNFDRIVGTFGLFVFNFIIVKFILNSLNLKIMKIITSIIVTIITFSLMSWEMILNGTGYPHFLTLGFIAIIFYLFDMIVKRTKAIMTLENIDTSDLKYYGNQQENNRLSNIVALIDTSQMQRVNLSMHLIVYILTIITSLVFAGSYGVSFLCTLIFFSTIEIFIFFAVRNKYNKGEIDSFDTKTELYEDFKEQYNNQEIKAFGKFKGEKYSTVNNESTFKIFFKFLLLIMIAIICLTCYFKSNNTGDPLVPVGTKDITLIELLSKDSKFPLRFFLKSLASSIIGIETFDYAINFNTIDENMIFLIGFIYIFILIFTVFLLIYNITHNETINKNIFDINSYRNVLPQMFIVSGIANYVLVFLARYQFVRDDYGMSSRYAIQYMFLTIGLILIYAIFVDDILCNEKYFKVDKKETKLSKGYLKRRERLVAEGKIKPIEKKLSICNISLVLICVVCTIILTFGNLTTTMDEIFKADYRKIAYEKLVEIAQNYKNYADDDLKIAFEYPRSAEQIKYAFELLEEKKLNVFRGK